MTLRKTLTLVAAFCLTATLGSAQSFWRDNLDTYNLGPWATQGGWTEWAGSSGVSGDIVSNRFLTGTQSGTVFGASPADDMIYDFAQLPGGEPGGGFGVDGTWATTINTFVESGVTGTGFVQWRNSYPDGPGGELSREIIWSINTGLVADTTGRGGTRTNRPIRYDEWVPLTVVVNLDSFRTDVFYAGERVNMNSTWTSDSTRNKIAALRFFAGQSSGAITQMYFDDMCLEKLRGVEAASLSMTPNPISGGQTMRIDTDAPELANAPGVLFATFASGIPIFRPVLFFNYSASGTFGLSAPVPAGTPALDIAFKVFALGSGLVDSNEMRVYFR